MEPPHTHATQHYEESDWITLKCVTRNVIEFLLTRQTASAIKEESYKAVEGEKADDRIQDHAALLIESCGPDAIPASRSSEDTCTSLSRGSLYPTLLFRACLLSTPPQELELDATTNNRAGACLLIAALTLEGTSESNFERSDFETPCCDCSNPVQRGAIATRQ